eukprot:8030539-Pyramimonas_sp.AAC.1
MSGRMDRVCPILMKVGPRAVTIATMPLARLFSFRLSCPVRQSNSSPSTNVLDAFQMVSARSTTTFGRFRKNSRAAAGSYALRLQGRELLVHFRLCGSQHERGLVSQSVETNNKWRSVKRARAREEGCALTWVRI